MEKDKLDLECVFIYYSILYLYTDITNSIKLNSKHIMKKNLFLIAFALFTTSAFAQVSWNVKTGLNISNMTNGDGTEAKVGFQIGGGMEYDFGNNLSLQPSLLLTQKGTKGKMDDIDASFRPMYLELPVMVAYRIKADDNLNVVFNAGPYLAYGVGGQLKLTNDNASVGVDLFGDKGCFNRFDAGLGLGVGFEVSRFVIGLNGEIGLANVLKKSVADQTSHNINFGMTLGYKF